MNIVQSCEIREAVAACLEAGVAFAVYREKDRNPVILVGDSIRDFVVTKWPGSPDSPGDLPLSTVREVYLDRVSELISRLRQRGGKTVVSRVITGDNPSLDIAAAAGRLFDRFPGCFCHIYYNPQCGLWMGASPELLLETRRGTLATMSLAGTRRPGVDWDEKNRDEQRIVTDFITSSLARYASAITVEGPVTLFTGSVEHLCTHISGKLMPGAVHADIAAAIAPTPAVSGFPRETAMAEIESIEAHSRQCYGGYITVCDGDRTVSYVNLRCARIDGSRFTVYAGGGITPLSVAGAEWEETALKAAPILEILTSTYSTYRKDER